MVGMKMRLVTPENPGTAAGLGSRISNSLTTKKPPFD